MAKKALFSGTLFCGIMLCVFGYKAFTAVALIIGVTAFGIGVYLMLGLSAKRGLPMAAAIALAAGGLLLVILAVFIKQVAYFFGGVLFVGAGILLMPLNRCNPRLILPFNIGCVILGLIIIFTPLFIGWLVPLVGVLLILYSITVLIFM